MPITAFVTPAALVDEFGLHEMVMLTDIGTTRTGAVDNAVAQRACNYADAEVSAALAKRYALPLSAESERCRQLTPP